MSEPMPTGASRALTPAEWAALSPGLARALRAAGVEPRIVARATMGARAARLWRGSTPIMAWGRAIYWPGAYGDMASAGLERCMATLQHELHHLWEYATGALTPLRYAVNPRHWVYGYGLEPDSRWEDFGAEQRACIAEDLWRIEHGLMDDAEHGARHRSLLPWAQSSS